ncbi:MAG: transposase [Planctomycetes bacterium]|nr:transposase [Planctomycetota bacterium]
MGKPRRKYTNEFKIEAVRQVVEHGRSVVEVSKALGIHENLLHTWKKKLTANGSVLPAEGEKSVLDLEQEVRELRKELAKVKMDREILKKATAYFAKDES